MNDLTRSLSQHQLDVLSWNTFYSKQDNLVYVATPKVACTSLKWWFAELLGISREQLCGVESGESDPDLVIHDAIGRVAPEGSVCLPVDLLVEALQADGPFRFALVRNPYKRIFSAWQSKLLLREPIQSRPYLESEFFNLAVKDASGITRAFEAFLEHLAKNEAPTFWDAHWTPQVDYLRPDLIRYTMLARLEATDELRAALAAHLGKRWVSDPFSMRRANESLIPYSPDYFSTRSIELIGSLYGVDFDRFGYERRLPEARNTLSSAELDVALQAIGLIRGRHQRLGELFASKKRWEEEWQSAHQHQLLAKDAQLAEVLKGKEWLESEWKATQDQVLAKDSQLAEMHKAKDWLESEWKAAQAGKEWLESEWKATQAQVLANDAHLAEMHKAKEWLESEWKATQAQVLAMEIQLKQAHDENERLVSQCNDLSARLTQLRRAWAVRALKKLRVVHDP